MLWQQIKPRNVLNVLTETGTRQRTHMRGAFVHNVRKLLVWLCVRSFRGAVYDSRHLRYILTRLRGRADMVSRSIVEITGRYRCEMKIFLKENVRDTRQTHYATVTAAKRNT